MKTRFQSLLVLVVLAGGVYGLGWVIGRQISAGLHRGEGVPMAAAGEPEAGIMDLPAAASDTNRAVLVEPGQSLAKLAEQRAVLQTLEAQVLELDRSRQERAGQDALGDFESRLRALPAEDFPAVWKWFSQLQSPGIRAKAQRALIAAWSRLDPRAALRAVLTLPDPWHMADESAMRERLAPYVPVALVLTQRGEKEPWAAMAWVKQLPEEMGPQGSALSVIEGMAKTDPKAAAQEFEKLPPSPARESKVLAVVAGLAAMDPEAAAAFLEKQQWSPEHEEHSSCDKDAAVARVAEALAALEPQKALAWAQTLARAKDRENALTAALKQMAGTGQTEEAARFVQSLPEAQDRQRLTTDLTSELALQDTRSAAAWADRLSGDESLRKAAWDGLKDRWVRQDPAAVVQFGLAAFPPGETRAADFRGIAEMSLAPGRGHIFDDDAAYNLTQQLPAGPERDAVAAVLARRWREFSPEHAAGLVASMTPGEEQARLAPGVAGEWASWDPAAAAAWAASFPAGEAREQSLPAVVSRWAEKDAAVAAQWLQTLPADAAQAKAAEAYVLKVADTQPELASRWVASIADEQQRTQQIARIGRQWLQKEAQAAREWLRQTSPQTLPKN